MEYLAYLLLALYSPQPVHFINAENHFVGNKIETAVQANATADSSGFRTDEIERVLFDDSIKVLYDKIGLENFDLSYSVFRLGMIGYYSLRQQGILNDKNILSIIDFTKSSCKKRFYTIDLAELKVKFYTYVSHGKNTGEDLAKSFSN